MLGLDSTAGDCDVCSLITSYLLEVVCEEGGGGTKYRPLFKMNLFT